MDVNEKARSKDIDIDELLKSLDGDETDLKMLSEILDENLRVVNRLNMGADVYNKLVGYRYIDNISEIHKGKYIRWIRNSDKKLTNGALVFDVKFYDNGSQILCKNIRQQMMQIKFDDCIIFQKLSAGEQLISMAYEHLQKC